MWVDQQTSICLKKEIFSGDAIVETIEVESFEIAPIEDKVFAPEAPPNVVSKTSDEGYREIPLEDVEENCGFKPELPSCLPEGFVLKEIGWRDPAAIGLPRDLPAENAPIWYKPVYLTYTDEGTAIYICIGKKTDSLPAEKTLGVNKEGNQTVLTQRATTNRAIYYVPFEHTLYAVLGTDKIRIRASLPVEELVKIAESLSTK